MKTLREIYDFLDSISPFASQESWDNSGLLIGKWDTKIKNIFSSLEVTKDVALQAEQDSLIVAHHPLIFTPLKNLNGYIYPNNIIEILVRKNISLIALHTNFDLSHLNEYFVRNVLGYKEYIKDNFICNINVNDSFDNFVKYIKSRMNILKINKASNNINRASIVCGAGVGVFRDELFRDNVNCIITGDIKYHDAMKLNSMGISSIDVGHYESERDFPKLIKENLKNIGYEVIIADSKNPFIFV